MADGRFCPKSNVSQISRFNEASLAGADERPITFMSAATGCFSESQSGSETLSHAGQSLCIKMTNVFWVTGSQGSSQGSSGGVPKQLGSFCSKHQPRLDILTANNQYDEAHISEQTNDIIPM